MILRKAIIENFRQVFGRHEIKFAPPGSRNVTVILGQNGAGKTTLLNAFLWCLYNRLDMENEEEVVCHKAIQDAAIGERVTAEVTLLLEDGPRGYTIVRRHTCRKLDGGRMEPPAQPDFRVDVRDESGVTTAAPDAKQLVQQLLPTGLSRFFFFRGEDMEALAEQRSAKELHDGVSEFLNFGLLKRSIVDLEAVGKQFEEEIRANAVGDLKDIADRIAAAEEERQDALSRLDTDRANKQGLEAQWDETQKQLAEFEEARPLLERKQQLVAENTLLKQTEANQRRAIASTLSRDGFLWKADEVLACPVRLADEAAKRGELPAKIKPKFVDDLLEAGKCVCGRPLDEHAREHLTAWRATTGLVQHEEAISVLRNAAQRFEERRKRVREDLARLRTDWAKTRDTIRKNVEEDSRIDTEVEGRDFHLDEIKATQTKFSRLKDDLQKLASDVTRAEDALRAIDRKLEGLRADQERKAKEDAQTQKYSRRFAVTQKVGGALERLRDGWLAIVQDYLDGQLKRNWERVAQLDRLVEFTNRFELVIKERGPDSEWIKSAPSSANRRALALCFVSALIKLASDIRAEAKKKPEEAKRLQTFQGGEYPLVMDAPFAHMDRHFKRTVPAGLREMVPQVVILSSSDQWWGEVEDVLSGAVGQAYVLELHIKGGPDDGSEIPFRGSQVDYVVAEADAATDWTVIREVTP